MLRKRGDVLCDEIRNISVISYFQVQWRYGPKFHPGSSRGAGRRKLVIFSSSRAPRKINGTYYQIQSDMQKRGAAFPRPKFIVVS